MKHPFENDNPYSMLCRMLIQNSVFVPSQFAQPYDVKIDKTKFSYLTSHADTNVTLSIHKTTSWLHHLHKRMCVQIGKLY
jgi:hypothetical protein